MPRFFLAVPLPHEAQTTIWQASEPYRREVPRISWVKQENYHITLQFLGDQSDEILSALEGELTPRLQGLSPIPCIAKSFGTFPENSRNPKIFWAGLNDGYDEVLQLATFVHEAVAAAKIDAEAPSDDKPYSPHITLARIKDRNGAKALATRVGTIPFEPEAAWTADRVTLFSSTTHSDGATYETVREFRL